MSLNTDGLGKLNPNNYTGFEELPADTYTAAGAQPLSGAITVAGLMFASAAGLPTAVTAASGAVTTTAMKGSITTDSLTLVNGQTYTLVMTNSSVTTSKRVYAQLRDGTNTTKVPLFEANTALLLQSITVGAGTVTFVIGNQSTLAALNGTGIIDFVVL